MAALVLAGCTAGGGADASAEGQVAYACALSAQITSPESWESAIGDEADPGAVAAQGTVSLLGGNSLYELPDHPELTDAARELGPALRSSDAEGFGAALDDIEAECADIEPPEEPAVDQKGQIIYACALANAVESERGDVQSWGSFSEDPAWHESLAAAALVGAANGGVVPGAEDLAEPATSLIRAVQGGPPEATQEALDGFIEGCKD